MIKRPGSGVGQTEADRVGRDEWGNFWNELKSRWMEGSNGPTNSGNEGRQLAKRGSKNDDMPVAGPTAHPGPLTLALAVEPPLSLLVDDAVDGGDGKSPP